MGGSSKQITGYKYHTSFILFIGNAIEKVLAINFDNRGWLKPLVDKRNNPIEVGLVSSPNLYGENEGGVTGKIHARYGSPAQLPVQFYSEYLAKSDIPPLAYQLQSYLAFEDFYVGNSGYMKEMLLWPKRIHVKNDGSAQWYDEKAEIAFNTTPLGDIAIGNIKVGFEHWYISSSNIQDNWARWSTYDVILSNTYSEIISVADVSNSGGLDSDLNYNASVKYIFTDKFIKVANVTILSFSNDIDISTLDTDKIWEKVTTTLDENTGARRDYLEICFVGNLSVGAILKRPLGEGNNKYLSADINVAIRAGNAREALNPTGLDINPIHKIREILTDNTAMNKPESEINNANFIKAADQIWDEGLGISWAIQEKSCIEAINELCFHIEAGIRINRQSGLYEMVLFRDDWFEESEIYFLAENKIKNIELEVINADEAINQLNVNFYDRTSIKASSFSIAENASIKNLNGKVNAETIEFPYFMNQRNAEIVSRWKLRQYSSAVWKGSFTTSEKQARKWNRYDIVKINWSKKGIANLPVRILSLKFGGHTSNTVTIEFEEVVSALGNLSTTIVIDGGIDNSVQPPKRCAAKVFELPYLEAVQANGERETNAELADNPETGFICAIAEKPQNNSLNAALYINDGSGFERSVTVHYCETAYLEDSINKLTSSFVVKNAGNLASVRIGSQIFINDEIMVYQSFNTETRVLTAKRGALDTVPQNHDADSIFYFADDFVAIDSTLYVEGERIDAKVLTTTPSGILSLDGADTHTIELNSRAIRPYPPANVKINGEYWPPVAFGEISLTWVDRNKMQQTGGEILGFYDSEVTLESGVTYSLKIKNSEDEEILIFENIKSPFSLTRADLPVTNIKLELFSIKNSYQSESVKHGVLLRFEGENFIFNSSESYTPAQANQVNFQEVNNG